MSGAYFADGFDRPDTIALGLTAPQLATVVVGAAGAYLELHAPLPAALRAPVAVLIALVAASLGWGRLAGRPLLTWAALALRHVATPRRGGAGVHPPGETSDTSPPPAGVAPTVTLTEPQTTAATCPPRVVPELGAAAADGATGADAEPAWAVWLRHPHAAPAPATPEHGSGGDDPFPSHASECSPTGDGAAALDVSRAHAPASSRDVGEAPAATRRSEGPPAPAPAAPLIRVVDSPLAAAWRRLRNHRAGTAGGRPAGTDRVTASTAPDARAALDPLPVGTVEREAGRPLLVLPAPTRDRHVPPSADGADDDRGWSAEECRAADADGDDQDITSILELPSLSPAPSRPPAARDSAVPAEVTDVPVFVGSARRLTFFSLNGGSGRTTLATEVATLLAARGRCRETSGDRGRPLQVALVDLDLRSASVAVRLGVPQPTLWDYLVGGEPDRLDEYMIRHRSGLRALLGPPKPMVTGTASVEPARIAELVHRLERDGHQIIVFDVGCDLGAVTTWVLSAVHDIYVVITPTASGVQDAYRSTEALRRLGLGHKLRYVVNRVRRPVDLRDTMSDLGGRLIARIPYDPRIEEAENIHQPLAFRAPSRATDAITALAAQIFPALDPQPSRSRLNLLGKRRAG